MLEKWVEKVEEKIENARATGQALGACIIQDTTGGQPICVLADQDTCTNVLNGTFLGGDCAGG